MKKYSFLLTLLTATGLFSNQAYANVLFTHYPMAGYAKLPPNVLLLLSVEYPTAKAAYPSFIFTANDIKNNTYTGYFNANLCYTYKIGSKANTSENGYFEPTSQANQHLCSGTSQEFSGNLLNAMSMTTIDIFRISLSGGNRAKGAGTTEADYEDGDTSSATFLRRASVLPNQNQKTHLMLIRRILSATAAETRKMTPYNEANLGFHNGSFNGNGHPFSMFVSPSSPSGSTSSPSGSTSSPDNSTPINIDERLQVFNVNVQVCADNPSFREENCVPYATNHYKPEGLLQQYSKQMRFGVFGYLATMSKDDGGIMRSRLKLLAEDTTIPNSNGSKNYTLGQEINSSTGQFIINPDKQDADESSVKNSGVINYVNKFGDVAGYKGYDPVGRLYYAGLRYLKGLSNPETYSKRATAQNKDNFPVITNWDDPLKRDSNQGCSRPNVMMIIGDSNTYDNEVDKVNNKIPGYAGSPFSDDPTNYSQLTASILKREQDALSLKGITEARLLSTNEKDGMPLVGQAYHAFTEDLRPDDDTSRGLPGMQTARTIGIDVIEKTKTIDDTYKPNGNPYFLASKYGGFEDLNGDGMPGPDRAEWTDDLAGYTSIPQFPQGTPRNFAVAQDTSSLDAALKAAFNSASKSASTQAAVTTPIGPDAVISPSNPNLRIITQYSVNTWSGDVLAKNSVGNTVWALSSTLNTQLAGTKWGDRKVYVQDGVSTKIFNSSNLATLSTAKKAALAFNGDNQAAARVDYILGGRSKEGANRDTSKPFRTRSNTSLLGTIINSPVAYLPSFAKENNLAGCQYASGSAPALSYAVAANDGMLHIFSSADQTEQMAFIPSSLFETADSDNKVSKAVRYTQKDYDHEYINDGVPATREMCFPNSGKTIKSILVGTAGRGGHSIYAIDGTNLASASEANVLWEFTHNDDADLGLTVSTPILTYDGAKRPIAIVSSGYNSSSNKSHIFVLRLDKGKSDAWSLGNNYYKIAISGNSNGLGEVEAVDKNNDGQPDLLYVGDIEGRLWKIDTASSSPSGWENKLSGKDPLFVAKDSAGNKLSIVAQPTYVNENGKDYIFFGTGRFFSRPDIKLTNQNVYGIIDKNKPITDSDHLVDQSANATPISKSVKSSRLLKATLQSGVIYGTTTNELTDSDAGWRFSLVENQMVTSQAIYNKGSIYIPIFQPSESTGIITAGSSCSVVSKSGFLALQAINGGMSSKPLFDTNGDKKVSSVDVPAGLILFEDAQSPTWSLVKTENGLEMMSVDGNGNIIGTVIANGTNGDVIRRLSWRELF